MRKSPPKTHTTNGIVLPATALALAGFRRRAWGWLGGGFGAVLVGVMVGPPADEAGIGWLNEIAVFCVGGGPVAVGVGVAALVNYRCMRRTLSAHPWAACSAVAIPPRQGNPRTVLRHPLTGDVIPLSIRTLPQRYHLANPDPGGVLWWCGDARTGGVLAQPGGEQLLWARSTRTGRIRRRDVLAAERQGLLNRPQPRQPQSSVGEQLIEDREPDLSYAALAEAARCQVIADEDGTAPRHEPDIRAVPWWRVPALLEISHVWSTAFNAAFAIAMVLMWWLLGKDRDVLVPLILAALSGFNALRFGRRMIHGIPGVKALAQAARAPVSVPKRYVLLPGLDDGLVLVLFAAHGGPDDLPEAAMEVNPPGTAKDPRRGMPPVVGTVDLRGWLNAGPTAVPWLDDRPLWPRNQYETVNLNDRRDRDYFAALIGGAGAKGT